MPSGPSALLHLINLHPCSKPCPSLPSWFLPPGQVLTLGGLRDTSGNLLLPGDSFVEPLSGKTVQLQGASQQGSRTVPHSGGPQALLDANVLRAQKQVIAVLQQCQSSASPGSSVLGSLEVAIQDMRQALALSLHHILQRTRRLKKQLEAADSMEASGGRIGMCCSGLNFLGPRNSRPRVTWYF